MIETILAIGIMLFAVLVPLGLVVAFIGHGIVLAKLLGGPLEYDLPDAAVYWSGKVIPRAVAKQEEIEGDSGNKPSGAQEADS